MQNFGAADARKGMLEWSEPVIFDCLQAAYAARLSDDAMVWKLARLHRRAWCALLSADKRKFEALRKELTVALERSGLDAGAAAEADARTLLELAEIVAARFRRCARLARGYRLALVELAEILSPIAKAA